MPPQDDHASGSGDLEVARRIDQICDEFESSYQRKENPRIEDYLDQTVTDQETLLVELVLLDVSYRRDSGDKPRLDEYAARFPSHPRAIDRLRDQFPTGQPVGTRPPPVTANLKSFEFLGAGSFGTVWKSWDEELHRAVAVKTPIRPTPTAAERALIQREAKIAAQIRHPNIVPVYSVGEVEGQVYIEYGFVKGTTLQKLRESERISPVRAAQYCLKIARAIAIVHQERIVHRDLKPSNILVDEFDEPHITDFGLAKQVDAASTIGIPDRAIGTWSYMSVEQSLGAEATDARSDLYSIGAILYELIAGRPVFTGTVTEIIEKIRTEAPAPLPESLRDLDRICRKCLEKDPRDRYQSATELAENLQQYLDHLPVKIRPVSRWSKFGRWIFRRLGFLFVIALSCLAIFLLLTRRPDYSRLRPVHVVTDPPGVQISVRACDRLTGEPDVNTQFGLLASTPGLLQMPPGLFQLTMTLPLDGKLFRHTAYRTVPDLVTGFGESRAAAWERWHMQPSGELVWPDIAMPQTDFPPFEMALIDGGELTANGPDGPRQVKVAPFYVMTREFTFGDFLTLRPGFRGNVLNRNAIDEPPGVTMPAEFFWALHWAEESGARLPTDEEFLLLALRAAEAHARRTPAASGVPPAFHEAGSDVSDQLPTSPPVRGILSGYAEWTSTWPSSPAATIDLQDQSTRKIPHKYRIIRGGTIDVSPEKPQSDPLAACVGHVDTFYPHVGFRLVVPVPLTPKNSAE